MGKGQRVQVPEKADYNHHGNHGFQTQKPVNHLGVRQVGFASADPGFRWFHNGVEKHKEGKATRGTL